jgi:hypothetical protein
MSLNAPAIIGKLSRADWPGPPAIMNTGSGSASPSTGIQASASSMLRPSGSAGFSGTVTVAHCASVGRGRPAARSTQGSNSISPRVRAWAGPGHVRPAAASAAHAAIPGNLDSMAVCLRVDLVDGVAA